MDTSASATDTGKDQAASLDKAFIPFSRGSRNCIGQNLAMAELAYTVAYLVRRVEMRFDVEGMGGDVDAAMGWKDVFVVSTTGHLKVRGRMAVE